MQDISDVCRISRSYIYYFYDEIHNKHIFLHTYTHTLPYIIISSQLHFIINTNFEVDHYDYIDDNSKSLFCSLCSLL